MPQTRPHSRFLRRDRRGTTTLETALVFIPFLTLMIAIVEIGWQFATAAMLDIGTLRAARFGITGQATRPGAPGDVTCRSQYLPWMLSTSTGGFLRQQNLTVTTLNYSSVSGVSGTGGAGAGTGGAIVRYDVTYPQPVLTAGWLNLIGGPGTYTHRAVILTKNEPFPNAVC